MMQRASSLVMLEGIDAPEHSEPLLARLIYFILTGLIGCFEPSDGHRTDETSFARAEFSAAEIGALAHLYRGKVYRSTIWRTRLDNTTIKKNADGGVTIYVGPKSPEGLESNWIPTAGKRPLPAMRLYGPTDAFNRKICPL